MHPDITLGTLMGVLIGAIGMRFAIRRYKTRRSRLIRENGVYDDESFSRETL
jgi:hypothetical protein